jgi:hypothetical protein
MKKVVIIPVVLFTVFASCSKQSERDFVGEWKLSQVYANDSWGAPFYWKNVHPNVDKRIKFTSGHQYFRKEANQANYTLVGTYKKLPGNKIEITFANPPNPSTPSYTLDYELTDSGYMTWGILATEGIIKEKFKESK